MKVDAEDVPMVEIITKEKDNRPFEIKHIATPKGGGYFTLHHAYQQLFLEVSDPNTYFLSVFTDEIRFKTKGWDTCLKQYIGLFNDDVFRLRVSEFRNKNYFSMYECLPMPENYAITTRKWYELTEGMCSISKGMKDVFWGVDSWHQCIEYYLGQCINPSLSKGIYRGWPIHDIEIGGIDAGVGWEGNEAFDRARRVGLAWTATNTYKSHSNFYRLAQKLAAHVWAHHLGHPNYVMINDEPNQQYLVYKGDPLIDPAPLIGRRYRLPKRVYLRELLPSLLNLHRVTFTNRIRGYLFKLPAPILTLGERILRRLTLQLARIWVHRNARKLPHKITENNQLKQVVIIDPRDGRPLKGWCYVLH